ncbi:hypothetical protein MKR28_11340, partial [Staphylococcus haemolyticus]|nr:hypothetical protein [Staphylococcus haemolyticus]
ISEIVHTEDSFLLKLYYKFNFATEPEQLSVEEYETFFNRFDNQEFDFERELTQDPYSKVYLYSIEDHIRTYKIEK